MPVRVADKDPGPYLGHVREAAEVAEADFEARMKAYFEEHPPPTREDAERFLSWYCREVLGIEPVVSKDEEEDSD